MGSLLITLLLSFNAFGAVQSFTLQGTSKEFDIRQNQNAWGVMAGPNRTDTNQAFDSCDIVPPEGPDGFEITPCHPRRINGDTEILIRFIETTDFNPARAVKVIYTIQNTGTGDGGVATNQLTELATSTQTYLPNQQAQITIQWRQICSALNGSMSPGGFCTDNGADSGAFVHGDLIADIGIWSGSGFDLVSRQSVTFKIYNASNALGLMDFQNNEPCDVPLATPPDPPLTGFCDLGVFPGDSGGFIFTTDEASDRSTRLIDASGISYDKVLGGKETLRYTGIRLYFAEDPALLKPFNSIPTVDFFIDSTNPLSFDADSFSGLKNGTTYYFKAASIDESGTISQFFSDQYCASTSNCLYSITPSEVAGVIQESSCFITTATYGSKYAYQVKIFQNFREVFLRRHLIGAKLIVFYETYGPHGAVFLNNHSYLKPAARIALYPLYLFASVSLAYGFFSALFLFFISTSVFLFFFRTYIMRKGY